MPCSDGSPRSYAEAEYSGVRAKLDKVTRLLCFVMGEVTKPSQCSIGTQLCLDNRELCDWWTEHQEEDRERLAREREARRLKQAREKARSKLTAEERRLLRTPRLNLSP